MFLHLGGDVVVAHRDILGIFDLDNISWSFRTREFLQNAEREDRTVWLGEDLPRSAVLVGGEGDAPVVYLSQISSKTLARRMEKNMIE